MWSKEKKQATLSTFRRKAILPLAMFAVMTAAGAYAQSDNGSIVGTVTDQTGAIVPNAGSHRDQCPDRPEVQCHLKRFGRVPHLRSTPPGNYQANVQASGFQAQTVSFAESVSTAQTLAFTLTPGTVGTTVQVTDAAPLVNTSNATIGEVIQGEQVTDLPLNGRNFTGLALLAPGVTRGAYGDAASGTSGNSETFRNSESGGAAISVNGLRPQADNFLLDGIG